jgi:hypothetical protein
MDYIVFWLESMPLFIGSFVKPPRVAFNDKPHITVLENSPQFTRQQVLAYAFIICS